MAYHYALRTPEVINKILDQRTQTIGTTPTLLNQKGGRILILSNTGDNTVYLGHEGVTTDIGVPLPPNATVEIHLGEGYKFYAVAETETNIRVLEAV